MQPIGGEFELPPILLAARPVRRGQPHPASGRGALVSLLRAIRARLAPRFVALPDYICESVIRAVEFAGLPVVFFRIGDDLHPDWGGLADVLSVGPAVVLLVSYFGLVDLGDDICHVRTLNPAVTIIKDDVHSWRDVHDLRGADVAFTSLRKSFPVPDGAEVFPPVPMSPNRGEGSFVAYKVAGAVCKYVRPPVEGADTIHLSLFATGEAMLDDGSSYEARASAIGSAILDAVDRDEVALRRRSNFAILERRLAKLGIHPIVARANNAVPLCLPVRLADRDAVRKALIREKIYCPVHWPLPSDQRTRSASRLYETELSLVIDQRYEQSDMHRVADALECIAARPAV